MSVFKKEPAVIVGAIASAVVLLCEIIGLDGFDDGVQWEEIVAIATPILASLGIRQSVFSPRTVEEMLPARPLGREKDAAAAVDVPERKRTR